MSSSLLIHSHSWAPSFPSDYRSKEQHSFLPSFIDWQIMNNTERTPPQKIAMHTSPYFSGPQHYLTMNNAIPLRDVTPQDSLR
mmetsp:Transcript_4768/g.6660  ORF Transcript_4768/g.6660 Transcript_4768/m.6660 type:complete len:83 (+) Transcript_4768:188-436(+)